MSDNIFKLEQEIMNCWNVVEDIDLLFKYFGDHEDFAGMKGEHADKIMNLMIGLRELYSVKFNNMFSTFEDVCSEYHKSRSIVKELGL